MNTRAQKLKDRLMVDRYPICAEKARLIVESLQRTEGEPQIVRRAKATAYYLDNRTIFIEDDELIVGNVASRPMGMEAGSMGPAWPEEDIEDLRKSTLIVSDEDAALLRSLDGYWKEKSRTLDERQGQFYDDERLWPFIQSGILCPPWQNKVEGRGSGSAGAGWGLGLGLCLVLPDYAKVLNEGLGKIISDAEAELKALKHMSLDAIKKADFLRSVLIVIPAIIRIADRFACLAAEKAKEENNPQRKRELKKITDACRHVPANPPRTFYEAVQSFWFIWLMVAGGTTPGGRFDQFMYPFYQKDRRDGVISDDEVLELLELLRIKVMQLNFVGGGKGQREKWAGMARWNNWVIGGVTPDGEDATNELSYLILEAALECQTPHHTITVRVHPGTPDALMLKALELVKTGIGMPAFIGDKSYISYLLGQGVPLRDARNFGLAGCIDVNLPGKSRINAFGMFIVPRVLEIAMNDGLDPRSGKQLGPRTGEFENFETFDAFFNAFREQLAYFMGLTVEEHNILLQAQTELFPDAVHSVLMEDALKVGRDVLDRQLPFENGSVLNPVGMINVADSLSAIKKLVFEEGKVTAEELKSALAANWRGNGYSEMRSMFLAAPKYGNGDEYVDSIAAELYKFWADTAVTFPSIWGGNVKPTGISITAHAPGGALTGATPDGRHAGETLADGTMSPAQARDTHGPTAIIRSALAIDQAPYQATLLNMKFHPSSLKSTEDLKKLSHLIKAYFGGGGKHIQFNVVDRQTLIDAQQHPELHRDLLIRVAGYSAYFVHLTKAVQDEIILRTEVESPGKEF
jgi:pyruvate formate-lyase/glycerol dehydratase family glycyl radical enzyme